MCLCVRQSTCEVHVGLDFLEFENPLNEKTTEHSPTELNRNNFLSLIVSNSDIKTCGWHIWTTIKRAT